MEGVILGINVEPDPSQVSSLVETSGSATPNNNNPPYVLPLLLDHGTSSLLGTPTVSTLTADAPNETDVGCNGVIGCSRIAQSMRTERANVRLLLSVCTSRNGKISSARV